MEQNASWRTAPPATVMFFNAHCGPLRGSRASAACSLRSPDSCEVRSFGSSPALSSLTLPAISLILAVDLSPADPWGASYIPSIRLCCCSPPCLPIPLTARAPSEDIVLKIFNLQTLLGTVHCAPECPGFPPRETQNKLRILESEWMLAGKLLWGIKYYGKVWPHISSHVISSYFDLECA